MARVVFHNLSTPYVKYGEDQKGFLNNGLLVSETGDVVLVHHFPSETYLRFLQDIQVLPEDVSLFVFDPYSSITVDEDIQAHISHCKYLDAYTLSPIELKIAREFNLKFRENYSLCQKLESRIYFRKIVKNIGLNSPSYEVLNKKSLNKLFTVLKMLFKYGHVFVRFDTGGGGLNGYTTNLVAFLKRIKSKKKIEPDKEIVPKEHIVTVEQWFTNVAYRVGIYFFIAPENIVRHLLTHEVLVDQNGLKSTGNRSKHWLPMKIVDNVELEGTQIVQEFRKMGYRGYVNFDCLVLDNGMIIWLETNPRFGMGSYSYFIAKKAGIVAAGKAYQSKVYRNTFFQDKNEDFVLNYFRDRLFNKHTMTGIIPYNMKFSEAPGCMLLEVVD